MVEKVSIIATIRALKGDPQYLPSYDVRQGPTAWKFSDYCRRHGFDRAEWLTQVIRDRTEGISPNCQLLTTYAAFLKAAEKEANTP